MLSEVIVRPTRSLSGDRLVHLDPLGGEVEVERGLPLVGVGVDAALEPLQALVAPHVVVAERAADGRRLEHHPAGDQVDHRHVRAVAVDHGDPLEAVVGDALGHVHAEVDEVLGLDVDRAGEVEVVHVEPVGDARAGRAPCPGRGGPSSRQTDSTRNRSVSSGRWAPCCSVEPVGRRTTFPSSIASFISGQVSRLYSKMSRAFTGPPGCQGWARSGVAPTTASTLADGRDSDKRVGRLPHRRRPTRPLGRAAPLGRARAIDLMYDERPWTTGSLPPPGS